MTGTQFYIMVGFPMLAVITSLVVSVAHIRSIRADIRELRSDMRKAARR